MIKDWSKVSFKEKVCLSCENIFTPNSGSQKRCDQCRFHCHNCGSFVKNKGNRAVKRCKNCASPSDREYQSVCINCGDNFKDTNGLSRFCKSCNPNRGICEDCGKNISEYAQRCNSCNAIFRYGYGVGDIVVRERNDVQRSYIKVESGLWKEYSIYVWESEHGEQEVGNVVHHKNGNSLDDRIENLVSITRSDHLYEHIKMRKNE